MVLSAKTAEIVGEHIAVASDLDELQEFQKVIWAAHGRGELDDDTATRLDAAARYRRSKLTASSTRNKSTNHSPPKKARVRSPDRARSLRRRRELAATSPLPPKLSGGFTTSQLAVLAVVCSDVQGFGTCRAPLDAIAARAGVSKTTARNAIQAAEFGRLLAIEYRPRPGRKSLTNVVQIISKSWLRWLARRRVKAA